MPHGLSDDQFDELIERYDEVFSDLLEYQGIAQAETAIADAADAFVDAGRDAYEGLSTLLDEREEAHLAYAAGSDVDWDISDYEDVDLAPEWLFYH